MTPPGRRQSTLSATRQHLAGAGAGSALRRDAARDLSAAAGLAGSTAVAFAAAGGLGADYVLKALLLYAAGAWLVWRGLDDIAAHPHARFGAANRVTLARLVLAALLAAGVGEPALQPPASAAAAGWFVVAAAALAALLDAVDGPLARRSGLASVFGARFDMETDAALTLVLCALVLQAGQAGPWVLASGLMRYAFVAAARPWPWLAAALPPSRRRRAVCVVQISTLVVCLAPIVPPPLATALAAASLALLATSFAIDVRTLARARRPTLET
ncbi:MAG: CDP-alcohol phosphatidyltransferase family protein [Rubrivivax sp.]|nr:CDP-alcohol phosphatidyltransferase family protein [Rubrivivax sp.]